MSSASMPRRKPFVPPRLTRYGMIEKITMTSEFLPMQASSAVLRDKTGFGSW